MNYRRAYDVIIERAKTLRKQKQEKEYETYLKLKSKYEKKK